MGSTTNPTASSPAAEASQTPTASPTVPGSDAQGSGFGALGGKLRTWVTDQVPQWLQGGAPLGVSLVLGVFVAFGITDDALFRLLRAHATATVLVIFIAVLGLSATVATVLWPRMSKHVTKPAVVLLLIAVLGSVLVAVWSVGDREQPSIAITPTETDTDTGTITVKIVATGHALSVRDHMLLRVAMFPAEDGVLDDAIGVCSYTPTPDLIDVPPPDGTLEDGEEPEPLHPVPDGSRVVLWQEQGPDSNGEVAVTADVTVDLAPDEEGAAAGPYLCAHAVLASRGDSDDVRASTQIIDLSQLR